MFYMLDLLTLGGLTINEKVIKKGFGYTINKALLYIEGKKFNVVLKEYDKGHSVILEVLEYNGEDGKEQKKRLSKLVEQHASTEDSVIKKLQVERRKISLLSNLLEIFIFYNAIQAVNNLIRVYYRNQLFMKEGVIVIFTLLLCLGSFIATRYYKDLYMRGR